MAKQTKGSKQPVFKELKNTFKYFPFINQKQPLIVLALIGIIFYSTSLYNEYALDDGIIIHQNDHVIKGFKGIGDILTKDAYESFYRRMNATDQLAGGRYRPLSVVSFAIEQQFIGAYPKDGLYPQRCWDLNENKIDDPEEDLNHDGVFNEVDCQVKNAFLRHFNNMWTYVLGCLFLYLVFRNYMFRDNQDMAFLSALIFLAHPMHTEAIANVKSRDEIFSLIFISLTFLYSFRYLEDKKATTLFWGCVMFLLALLSKEYAVVLLGLIPLAIWTFTKHEFDLQKFLKPLIGYVAIGGGLVVFLKGYGAPAGGSGSILMLGGLGVSVGGIMLLAKGWKDYKDIFTPIIIFSVCLGIMLYIKFNFDIHAKPGDKPDKSFWLFPFVYAGAILLIVKKNTKKDFNNLMTWYYFVMLFYLGMRLVAVKLKPGVPDTELLNNPYLLADGQERFCTKAYVLFKYLTLHFFPHPLSSDYSYNTIAYRHFTDWDFIASMIIHLSLVYITYKLILKKHVLGFAFGVYIAFLLMIGNVLMDIGATMGERLMFHSSIGFCIFLAWLILEGFEKIKAVNFNVKRAALIGMMSVVIFLYGCKAWERNWDWKSDITLFIKDANTMPNSVLVLGNAGARWIDLADTKFFNKQPGDNPPLPFSTYEDNMLEFTVDPNELIDGVNKKSFITPVTGEFKNDQHLSMKQRSLYKGISYLKHATELHPRYVNGYLNLGLAYYKLKRDREALYFWKHAERLYPNNPYLKNYYIVFYQEIMQRGYAKAQRGRSDSAAYELNKATILDRYNPEGWYNLGGAYFNLGLYKKAKNCWQEALKLNPNHAQALQGMKSLTPQMTGEAPIVTVAPTAIKK
ncbi:MAG TPA: tetratricopeptide repeat protein [Bacteroidia bacterium]|jgi:tetratricopeptide (TPR) repeat protein|nr:tetratricopeptide repeat protein [Bacteroidia bacterium]